LLAAKRRPNRSICDCQAHRANERAAMRVGHETPVFVTAVPVSPIVRHSYRISRRNIA
jgi:hypothetical protein